MTAPVDRRAATFFALANLLAGGIHYAFQVWCSTQLEAVDFGVFNSWYAYFSLALSGGAFAQYLSNFVAVSKRTLTTMSLVAVGLSFVGLAMPMALGSSAGGWSIGATGVVLALLFNWSLGQAQIRLHFYNVGIALLLAAVGKFLLAGIEFSGVTETYALAWAASVAYAPALLFVGLPVLIRPHLADPPANVPKASQGLAVTAILAVASVYIPQLDIIVIHQTQAPEVIGQFARVSILYKAVFFGFLIIAQWLLPYQVRAAGGESDQSLRHFTGKASWRLRAGFLMISLAMAAFVYELSQFMVIYLMHRDFSSIAQWTILSCVNMALLTNLFFHMQMDCVQRRVTAAAFVLGALAVELGVGVFLKLEVTTYLWFVILFNILLWLVQSVWGQGRGASAAPNTSLRAGRKA